MSSRTEDELAIRSLVARYADAVNRGDAHAWGENWAEDGVWEIFGNPIQGRDAVVAAWSGAMAGFEFVVHLVHSGLVEVGDGSATGRWVLSELGRTTSGERMLLAALYHDAYRREPAGWRFASRRLEVLYQGPPDLT